jgi:hypothetical protein
VEASVAVPSVAAEVEAAAVPGELARLAFIDALCHPLGMSQQPVYGAPDPEETVRAFMLALSYCRAALNVMTSVWVEAGQIAQGKSEWRWETFDSWTIRLGQVNLRDVRYAPDADAFYGTDPRGKKPPSSNLYGFDLTADHVQRLSNSTEEIQRTIKRADDALRDFYPQVPLMHDLWRPTDDTMTGKELQEFARLWWDQLASVLDRAYDVAYDISVKQGTVVAPTPRPGVLAYGTPDSLA